MTKNKIGGAAYNDPSGVIITQFGLAYLANMLLISGSNDYKNKEISDRQNLLTLMNIYSNDLVAPPPVELAGAQRLTEGVTAKVGG